MEQIKVSTTVQLFRANLVEQFKEAVLVRFPAAEFTSLRGGETHARVPGDPNTCGIFNAIKASGFIAKVAS